MNAVIVTGEVVASRGAAVVGKKVGGRVVGRAIGAGGGGVNGDDFVSNIPENIVDDLANTPDRQNRDVQRAIDPINTADAHGTYNQHNAPNGVVDQLPQDQNVNPIPPQAKDWNDRRVGQTASQNEQVQADAAAAEAAGAEDIRINQQQVNANGERVGINRPDLQYTLNGRRYYVEYERDFPPRGRGPDHIDRILSNDPDGTITVSSP